MYKRSDNPFPLSANKLNSFLNKAWTNGWLDCYSDKHFLIKCINNQLTKIEWENQLLSNNSNSIYSPITYNGKIDFNNFTVNFITNLSTKLMGLSNAFGEDKIKSFIENQLSAGKSSYNRDMFFQALSEVEILCFYAGRFDWDEILYEPPIGANGSNPEARFVYKGEDENASFTINIEVKTPSFPLIPQQRSKTAIPSVLLTDIGRKKFQNLCEENGFRCVMPRVTKLAQFINSAAQKFEVPKENDFNLLYINWSYSDFPSNGFLEPWSLLSNEINGILTHPDIGTSLPFNPPICSEAYEKISAIIVYTSSLDQLMFSNFLYSWQTSPNVGPRFRMFILNKDLREKEFTNTSNAFFKITGMNPSKLEPNKWRLLLDCNWTKSTTIEEKAIDSKFSLDALNIISTHTLSSSSAEQ